MGKVSSTMLSEKDQSNYTEEKIPVQAYASSADLKNEIGRRIINRSKTHWDIVQIFSEGPFIYLKFKYDVGAKRPQS
ncbi:MAG: hypothetical protein ACE5NG_16670 [bacterium]